MYNKQHRARQLTLSTDAFRADLMIQNSARSTEIGVTVASNNRRHSAGTFIGLESAHTCREIIYACYLWPRMTEPRSRINRFAQSKQATGGTAAGGLSAQRRPCRVG